MYVITILSAIVQTKLTLRLDHALVRRAKAYARRSGKSVSGMVADFFALLDAGQRDAGDTDLTPNVRSLLGALKGTRADEEDYRRYLDEKYG